MKKTFSLLLVLFCSLALRAERFEYNNIFYNTLSDSTVEVTTQTEWGFAGYNHESLVIPQTVDYQGKTYRVIRIGQAAFYEYTSLTSITIPNTVTSIGIGAFYKCEKLDNLTIPASVTTIEKEAFLNCTGLTSFKFDYSSSLTTIGEKAFAACCSLRAIDIPYRVTSIGQGAFQECQALKTVYLTENLGSIEDYVFYGCTSLQSINLPDNITHIGISAFDKCSALNKIYWPKNLTTIGDFAFNECALTSLIVPNNVTIIGQCAFRWCLNLSSITIPSSTKYIMNNAFKGCEKLTKVICMATTPPRRGDNYTTYPGDWVFDDVNLNNAILYVPAESIELYTISEWQFFGQILPIETTMKEQFPILMGLQRTEVGFYTDGVDKPYLLSFDEYTPTEVDGKLYLCYAKENGYEYYFREEKDRVLWLAPRLGINEEKVLYDWTLEVGDTLKCARHNADQMGYLFRVTNVSTVRLLDGKEYKKWTLSCGTEYIEGIGAINGEGFGIWAWLEQLTVPATYVSTPLVCASKNGQLLYKMDESKMEQLGVECLCDGYVGTSVETITTPDTDNLKLLHNGQLLILRDGKTYNIMGMEITK